VLGALLPGLLCNDSTIRISGEPTERQSEHDHEHNAAQSHPHYQQLEATMDDVESGNVPTEEPNHSDENFVVDGDPTETCIIDLAIKHSHSAETLRQLLVSSARHDEIPFDCSTKYMATVHDIDITVLSMLKEFLRSTEWTKCSGERKGCLFALDYRQ
jgi:magnesium-transporting ATPase (P-type)